MGNEISLPVRRIIVTICASSLLLPVAQARAPSSEIDLADLSTNNIEALTVLGADVGYSVQGTLTATALVI
jgi:hypothetical protein